MATAGRTVLFSGLTVAAALASLLIFPQNFLRSMGYGGMAAVAGRDARRADRAAGAARRCSAAGSMPAGCRGAGTGAVAVDRRPRRVGAARPQRDAPAGRLPRRHRRRRCSRSPRRSSVRSGAASTSGCCPPDRPADVAARRCRPIRRRDLEREPAVEGADEAGRWRRTSRELAAASTASSTCRPWTAKAVDGRRSAGAGDLGRATARPSVAGRRQGHARGRRARPAATVLVGGLTADDRRPGRLDRRRTCRGWR